MAFVSAQITLTGSTATNLLTAAVSAGAVVPQQVGTTSDPIPIWFMITTGTVYWGGPTVTNSNGGLMVANSPVIMNIYDSDAPYVYSTGTPTVYVVIGRQ